MADKEWGLDCIKFYDNEGNCKQYKEEEYYIYNNVADYKKCCEKCAFYCKAPKHQLCSDFVFTSFNTIKKIFVWAQEYPATTNADKLTVVFGKNYGSLIASKMSQGWQSWLEEEYKEPTKEEND